MFDEKPTAAHHVLISLNVTGGFLAGTTLDLVDGLNCFIGGRGAGKTTALEFLRYGLGLMPDPRINAARHRGIEALMKANLGSGRLTIELRTKADMRYTASRGVNESVQVVNASGIPVPISLDRDQIFTADIFSQNEIEDIASNPAAQLELLDRFQESESAGISRELEQIQRKLDQSTVEHRQLDDEIEDLAGKASELSAIQERLKGLVETEGPDAARINTAHEGRAGRIREQKLPDALAGGLRRLVADISGAETAFVSSAEVLLDPLSRAGPNGDIFQDLYDRIQVLIQTVAANCSTIKTAALQAEGDLGRSQALLVDRHALQEAEYRDALIELEEQGGRAAERAALQDALADAQLAAEGQSTKVKLRVEFGKVRAELLKRASELRDRRFELRKRVAERLSQQFATIRVTVAQAADVQQYRELLTDGLKGAGLKQGIVADRLSQVLLPSELARAASKNDHIVLMGRAGFDEDRARKVVQALRMHGFHYRIETVELEDRPSIELLDGKTYKESSSLSTGQRCTSILPILMVQSERPLLIDQPEDNLDNAFVYDTIVKALRDVKGKRQVIFVTHNPNIPVLGEAERVFVFGSDGLHATLRQAGTVDMCKDDIERILEGGREAFLRRKERYGH